ncbi:MAG: Rrf2 family transcriptional regulator [Syntrophales bacterium]|nr:Rrf2 family transcriptional regulator [Syntrophales bacterium]MDD5643521.1 Rrf2 family transcriptional regulator [Syntrophales bacterium]
MKLTTRSRYGTRLLLDMAQHYDQGPIQLGDIARRQGISVKYLEQIIIPLKKARLVESIRGPKGGHALARPPAEITVAEIVALLEDGASLVECTENAAVCGRADTCPTRLIWKEASQAMFNALEAFTLADLVEMAWTTENKELAHVL